MKKKQTKDWALYNRITDPNPNKIRYILSTIADIMNTLQKITFNLKNIVAKGYNIFSLFSKKNYI